MHDVVQLTSSGYLLIKTKWLVLYFYYISSHLSGFKCGGSQFRCFALIRTHTHTHTQRDGQPTHFSCFVHISKLMVTCINKQHISYLEKYNRILDHQQSFRHRCWTGWITLHNAGVLNWPNGESEVVELDISIAPSSRSAVYKSSGRCVLRASSAPTHHTYSSDE